MSCHKCPSYCHVCPEMTKAIRQSGHEPEPGEDVMPACATVAMHETGPWWIDRCTCDRSDEDALLWEAMADLRVA